MQEQIDKVRNQTWGYLEKGQWDNALAAASYLLKLDPHNEHNITLAKYIREIALIADSVRGVTPLANDTALHLEEIARQIPSLVELASFKALLEAAKTRVTGKSLSQSESQPLPHNENKTIGLSEALSSSTTAKLVFPPKTDGDIHSIKHNNVKIIKRNEWGMRVLCPAGKAGVIITVLVTLLFVLSVNAIAYKYIEVQIPDVSSWGTIPSWRGIKTYPVDNLLLGAWVTSILLFSNGRLRRL